MDSVHQIYGVFLIDLSFVDFAWKRFFHSRFLGDWSLHCAYGRELRKVSQNPDLSFHRYRSVFLRKHPDRSLRVLLNRVRNQRLTDKP